MDTPFPTTAWRPTKVAGPGESERTEAELTALISRLNDQTKHIYKHPYDPNTWLQRAKTLARLAYPELAVGDAHKASLLAREHLARFVGSLRICRTDAPPGDDHAGGESVLGWRLGHRMGFWMQDVPEVAKGQCEAEAEPVDMLETYLAQLQCKAERVAVENLYFWPNFEEGRYRRRRYPWMREAYARRGDEVLERLNTDFEKNARDVLRKPGGARCVVKRHAFGRDDKGKKDTSDVLGVFATRDIGKDEVILVDKTRTWGCNGPGRDGDLSNLFGGKACGDPIHPNDDSDPVTLDLRWIRDAAGKQASFTLLNVRLLLCCARDGPEHPLNHPLVARLTPTYSENRVLNFSLENDVVIPNTALQQLGIDIFANTDYDTWVLFTMQARVDNNSCGDPMTDCLNPLFSLYNHSCEPNLRWTTQEDHRTIVVKAARDLVAGEQLFVEYDSYMSDQPLEIRRKRLWRWLEGPCCCVRCVREEKDRLAGNWKPSATGNEDGGVIRRVDEKMEFGDELGGWQVPDDELPVL
jgi:hypothetical protein